MNKADTAFILAAAGLLYGRPHESKDTIKDPMLMFLCERLTGSAFSLGRIILWPVSPFMKSQ